jgi:uncharacterized surface protein with fasciclin (FAS1) repeats
MRKFFAMLIVLSATPAFAQQKDIVDTAVAAGSFKTLAAALQAADLVDALKGPGPFTVMAPTDEAFAKLPKGTLENLLKPENKATLAGILKYHVISGKVPASTVVTLNGKTAKTLQGGEFPIKVDGGTVCVGNEMAKVTKTDIMCSNGIIHVIDTVILPPAK